MTPELVDVALNIFGVGFMLGFATLVLLTMLFATLAVIRGLAGIS